MQTLCRLSGHISHKFSTDSIWNLTYTFHRPFRFDNHGKHPHPYTRHCTRRRSRATSPKARTKARKRTGPNELGKLQSCLVLLGSRLQQARLSPSQSILFPQCVLSHQWRRGMYAKRRSPRWGPPRRTHTSSTTQASMRVDDFMNEVKALHLGKQEMVYTQSEPPVGGDILNDFCT